MSNIIQTIRFARRPVDFLVERQRRYGDAFRIRLLAGPACVMFSHPRAIQEIFQADDNVLKPGQAYQRFTSFLNPRSMLHLDGKTHRLRKQLVVHALSSPFATEYAQIAYDMTSVAAMRWPTGTRVKLDPLIDKLALAVTGRLMFGRSVGPVVPSIVEAFTSSIRPYNNPGWLMVGVVVEKSTNGIFVRNRRRLMTLIVKEADRRRRESNGANGGPTEDEPTARGILDRLLATDAATSEYPTEAIGGDVITMMSGLYFTISGILKRTLWLLSNSPEEQHRLIEELYKDDRSDDIRDLSALPYLDAVFRESLRYWPHIPFALRYVAESTDIDGHPVRRGEIVGACNTLTHRRPEIYPEPDRFRPDRFLTADFSQFEYYPYGGGSRVCAAAALAPLLSKAVLAAALRARDFVATDRRPMPVTLRGIFVMPARALNLELQRPHQLAHKVEAASPGRRLDPARAGTGVG